MESAETVTEASNMFAFDLYARIRTEQGNQFFSPFSASAALAMVREGAVGQTGSEIDQVFHFPGGTDALRNGYAALHKQLNPADAPFQLSVANALWGQKQYEFLPGYISTLQSYYASEANNLDIAGDPEGARQTVNNWVAGKTNDKIKDLFPAGSFDECTRLVLTNAVYFKGSWEEPFNKDLTQDQEFRTPRGPATVPMMRLTGESHSYVETDSLQALELPYRGGQLSMLILLPKSDDISSIEPGLSAESLAELRSKLSWPKVNVSLPRFTYSSRYSLGETLSEMGMPTAFGDLADFSGMDGQPGNLRISLVVHQAFVDVNEEGTEAAAATGVAMAAGSAFNPEPPKEFRADHPFIFFILEKETGLILFMGRVENPNRED